MKSVDKIIIVLGLIAVIVATGFILPAFTNRTNCGGNSAALTACSTYASCIQMHEENSKPTALNICSLSSSDRMELVRAATSLNNWFSNTKFLVRTNLVLNANPKQMIIVCDTPFDNVPKPTLWNGYRKKPAHAVGYSDGSVAVIRIEEFKKLDLSGFADVTALGTNAVSVLVNTNQGSF